MVTMLSAEEKAQALANLQDADWEVRHTALQTLAADDDPYLVDVVLPCARDSDEDVRSQALRVLARFDDPRVLSELIAALDDVHDKVRTLAHELLEEADGVLPALEHVRKARRQPITWRQLRAQADAVLRWTSRMGQELLGMQVVVQRYDQGLGRTYTDRRRNRVEIELSEVPVTSGHPHGEDIMRGLALHEIGHHLA